MKIKQWMSGLAPWLLALGVLSPVCIASAQPRAEVVVETGPRHHHYREDHDDRWRARHEWRERHMHHERRWHREHRVHEVVLVP
jgi:hypothetical protein